jgi:hypothetical protein
MDNDNIIAANLINENLNKIFGERTAPILPLLPPPPKPPRVKLTKEQLKENALRAAKRWRASKAGKLSGYKSWLKWRNSKPENLLKVRSYNKKWRSDPAVREKLRLRSKQWLENHPDYVRPPVPDRTRNKNSEYYRKRYADNPEMWKLRAKQQAERKRLHKETAFKKQLELQQQQQATGSV